MISEAPPHPRGSTRSSHPVKVFRGGSPAPAGIDPPSMPSVMLADGLPRTRGDRPSRAAWGPCGMVAPPHPRGSTLIIPDHHQTSNGSPAPAGIDPVSVAVLSFPPGLPRTRGDRPCGALAPKAKERAPPHPRGSTLPGRTVLLCDGGSPAPAGIDPRCNTAGGRTGWLPRTRGDRPLSSLIRLFIALAPPHPRGSTQLRACGVDGAGGSPAPAGIDPAPPRSRHRSRRLPRTRGDRPRIGMPSRSARMAPPHPRGSTLLEGPRRTRDGGSPAPAGIDPR